MKKLISLASLIFTLGAFANSMYDLPVSEAPAGTSKIRMTKTVMVIANQDVPFALSNGDKCGLGELMPNFQTEGSVLAEGTVLKVVDTQTMNAKNSSALLLLEDGEGNLFALNCTSGDGSIIRMNNVRNVLNGTADVYFEN